MQNRQCRTKNIPNRLICQLGIASYIACNYLFSEAQLLDQCAIA
jgi:hypothetical protein